MASIIVIYILKLKSTPFKVLSRGKNITNISVYYIYIYKKKSRTTTTIYNITT